MKFEWDENKRQLTIRKHGVDMLYAAGIFEGRTLTRIDPRHYEGEQRSISIGIVEANASSSFIPNATV